MNRTAQIILLFFCIFSTTFIVAILIWAANKGLDFSDESLYIIGFNDPSAAKQFVSYFPQFYGRFFNFIESTVVNLRIFRILLTVFVSTVLGYSIHKWLKTHNIKYQHLNISKYNLIFITLIGAFLSYTWLPQTLSYNSLSMILLEAICAIILLQGSSFKDKHYTFILCSILIGFLYTSLLLIKFPVFFLLFPILIGCYWFNQFQSTAGRTIYFHLWNIVAFTLGMTFYFFIQFQSIDEISLLLINMYETLVTNKSGAHSVSTLFKTYYNDVERQLNHSVFRNFFLLLAISFALLYNKYYIRKSSLNNLLGVLIVMVLAYFFWQKQYYLGGVVNGAILIRPLLVIASILLFTYFLSQTVKTFKTYQPIQNKKILFLLILLTSLPFVGMLGTNNPLSYQVFFYLCFIFPIIYIMIQRLAPIITSGAGSAIMIVLMVISSSQILYGVVYFPYRLEKPLTECTESLEKFGMPDIQLNENRIDLMKRLNRVLYEETSFQKGDPILTFRHELGMVYLLGGKMPVYSWLRGEDQISACNFLKETEAKDDLNKSIILFPKSVNIEQHYIDCMNKVGIGFPYNYQLMDEIPYWRYTGQDTLLVYAPIE